MNSIERKWICLLFCLGFIAFAVRAYWAIRHLLGSDVTALLAFPLTVILPAVVFVYLGQLRNMASEEGALMQLGVMIQLLLILALPSFALHLVLGFPVVFLVVEMFETRAPASLRVRIKRRILI